MQILPIQVQQCIRLFFDAALRCSSCFSFVFLNLLTASRLRSASIWAMRGSLYALGVVLIPLPHPDSSMSDATLFITFLGLSIMFGFGLVMLSQSLPPEMAYASPDARSLGLRHDGRESYFNVAIQNESCIMPSCGPDFLSIMLLIWPPHSISPSTASEGACFSIWASHGFCSHYSSLPPCSEMVRGQVTRVDSCSYHPTPKQSVLPCL